MLVEVSFLLVAHSLSLSHTVPQNVPAIRGKFVQLWQNILRGEWNVANKLFIKFF